MKQYEKLDITYKACPGLCNMQCKYCFYCKESKDRENRIMSRDTAEVLIDRISEYSPFALSVVFQGGEPTLCGIEFFKYFVRRLKEKVACEISFALQTNGLLLDDAYCSFFKENNFLIGISLDGRRRTNDRYRVNKKGESVFLQVMNAVSVLKKHGVDFNILSVIDNENAKDIESTYRYFRKHGFYYLQFIPYVDEGYNITLSDDEYERFLKKSFDLWYGDLQNGEYISVRHIDNYINILLGNPPESCAMCGICGNYFVVEANGDVYPCDFYCRKEYKICSVFDDKPFEMSQRQEAFIESSKVIHEYCKDCKYHVLCRGGCMRDRVENGTKNKYCTAYYNFFEYSLKRMVEVSEIIKNG